MHDYNVSLIIILSGNYDCYNVKYNNNYYYYLINYYYRKYIRLLMVRKICGVSIVDYRKR